MAQQGENTAAHVESHGASTNSHPKTEGMPIPVSKGGPDTASRRSTDFPFMVGRLPPAPPLTPPVPASNVFPFTDRRPNYAVSIPPRLDSAHQEVSFIHQPNPDYTADSSADDAALFESLSAPPRSQSHSRMGSAETNLAQSPMPSRVDGASPSSFPSTSPLLPPPPPGQEPKNYRGNNTPTGEPSVQGEILSVVDGAGAGWSRHTRVYGGGVCLACLAAESNEDAGENGHEHGGSYGDNVPLEDQRP